VFKQYQGRSRQSQTLLISVVSFRNQLKNATDTILRMRKALVGIRTFYMKMRVFWDIAPCSLVFIFDAVRT
jgi:hypothetical protein